jgi:hypothetical protein
MSHRHSHRISRWLALALSGASIAGVAGATPAFAQPADNGPQVTPNLNLRSHTVHEAGRGVQIQNSRHIPRYVDLRSPDARDAARGVPVGSASLQTPTASDDSTFDWGDAGIGAGAALALVALAGGGVAVSRRSGSLTTPRP